ncbi:hypothetical protein AB4Z22_00140 [Paenibacillus sp. TAF58]
MFCVIQKVINKKNDPYGSHKELLVGSYTITVDGETTTKYNYRYSEERFHRPIRDAYKIAIHHNYRDGGAMKKKQWVIGTMGYYDLFASWAGDHIVNSALKVKLEEMELSEERLWEMVNEKLDPIIAEAEKEFEKTEEYKAKRSHEQILDNYRKEKKIFESVYGSDTFDYCYDIFMNLRNEQYRDKVVSQYKAQQQQQRSYYDNKQSNYSGSADSTDDFFKKYSSYFGNKQSNYSDEEKGMLKKIYRTLSKSFHPDITKDDGEIMKFVNKLKEGWGI